MQCKKKVVARSVAKPELTPDILDELRRSLYHSSSTPMVMVLRYGFALTAAVCTVLVPYADNPMVFALMAVVGIVVARWQFRKSFLRSLHGARYVYRYRLARMPSKIKITNFTGPRWITVSGEEWLRQTEHVLRGKVVVDHEKGLPKYVYWVSMAFLMTAGFS